MMNLKELLSKRLNNGILLRVIIIAALIGVADTVYLTADHYFGIGVQCLLVEGCEVVLTSSYSIIFGIPLAAIGLVFYVGMFILSNLADIYHDRRYLKLLIVGGTIGFVASLVFLYLQIFVIEALCFYCLMSLTTSTIIFVSSILIYKNKQYGTS